MIKANSQEKNNVRNYINYMQYIMVNKCVVTNFKRGYAIGEKRLFFSFPGRSKML